MYVLITLYVYVHQSGVVIVQMCVAYKNWQKPICIKESRQNLVIFRKKFLLFCIFFTYKRLFFCVSVRYLYFFPFPLFFFYVSLSFIVFISVLWWFHGLVSCRYNWFFFSCTYVSIKMFGFPSLSPLKSRVHSSFLMKKVVTNLGYVQTIFNFVRNFSSFVYFS